jgi:hypothetical protein
MQGNSTPSCLLDSKNFKLMTDYHLSVAAAMEAETFGLKSFSQPP